MSPVSKRKKEDPLPLNCPMCGEKLVFVRNDGAVGVYQCANDGLVLHPPDGDVRVVVH